VSAAKNRIASQRLPRRVRGAEPDQIHERSLSASFASARASGKFTAVHEPEIT
jgi:hypothetical protein